MGPYTRSIQSATATTRPLEEFCRSQCHEWACPWAKIIPPSNLSLLRKHRLEFEFLYYRLYVLFNAYESGLAVLLSFELLESIEGTVEAASSSTLPEPTAGGL